MLDYNIQIGIRFVDPMHRDLLPRYATSLFEANFVPAGTVKPQVVTLRSLREGDALAGCPCTGSGSWARIGRYRRMIKYGKCVVHHCTVVAVKRRSVFIRWGN